MEPDVTSLLRSATSESLSDGCLQMSTSMLPNALHSSSGNALQAASIGSSASRPGILTQPYERIYSFSRFSRDSGATGADAASKFEDSKSISVQSFEPYNKPTSARNRTNHPAKGPGTAADPPPSGSPSAVSPPEQRSSLQQDDCPAGGRSLRQYTSNGLHRSIIQRQQQHHQQAEQYGEQARAPQEPTKMQQSQADDRQTPRQQQQQQQQQHVSWEQQLGDDMPVGVGEEEEQRMTPMAPLSLQSPFLTTTQQQEQQPASNATTMHVRSHSRKQLLLLQSPGPVGALALPIHSSAERTDRTDTWDALVRDDSWMASLLHTSKKQGGQAGDVTSGGMMAPSSPAPSSHPTLPYPPPHPHPHPHAKPAPGTASSETLPSASSPEPPSTTPRLHRGRGTLLARHSSQVLLPPLFVRAPGAGGLDASPCFFGPDALPGLLVCPSPRNSDCGVGSSGGVGGGGGDGGRNSGLAPPGGNRPMVAHAILVSGADRHQQTGMVANAAVVLPIDSSSMSLPAAPSRHFPNSSSTSVNACIAASSGIGGAYGDLMPSGVEALGRSTSYQRTMPGAYPAPTVGRSLAAEATVDAHDDRDPLHGAGHWMVWAAPDSTLPDNVGDISLRRPLNAPPPPLLSVSHLAMAAAAARGTAAAAPDDEKLLLAARGSVSQAIVLPFQLSGPLPVATNELEKEVAETLPVAEFSAVGYEDAPTLKVGHITATDGGGGSVDAASGHRCGGSAGSGRRTPDGAAAEGCRAPFATLSNVSASRASVAVSACASRCTPSTARTSTVTACRFTADSAASNLLYGSATASPATRVASPSDAQGGNSVITTAAASNGNPASRRPSTSPISLLVPPHGAASSTAVGGSLSGVAPSLDDVPNPVPSADGRRHSYADDVSSAICKASSRDGGATPVSCSPAEAPLWRWKRAARSAGLAASIARGFRTLRYQHEENLVKDEQLRVISEIGSGTFARVDKCMYSPADGGKPFLVAVKRIRSEMLLAGHDPEDLQLFIQEAQLLRKLNHPNIVQYIGLGIQLPDDPPDGVTPNLEHISLQLAQPPPTHSLPNEPRRPGGGRVLRRASVGATPPPRPPPVRGMFIVEEFMGCGTLKSAVYKQMLQPQRQIYSNATALRWMAQIAGALSYMHTCRPKVLHRDIKLDNVLLRREGSADPPFPSSLDDCSVKLGDLGLAALLAYHRRGTSGGGGGKTELMETLDSLGVDLAALRKNSDISCAVRQRVTAAGQAPHHLHLRAANDPERLSRMLASHRRERLGTYMYMAPEVYRRQKYDEKCDCFSFAIVLYEVFHRFIVACSLEDSTQMERYARQVSHGFRPTLHEDLPAPLRRVIRQCWAQDPEDRPDMAAVAAELWALQSRGVVAALDRKQQSAVWKGCGSLSRCCVVS